MRVKGPRLPSLIIRPGLSFQVVDSQRKLLEKTSSPLSGEYNHIEFECKAVLRIFFTLPLIKWLVALWVHIVWTRPDGCWLGLSSFHFIFGKCHSKKSWLYLKLFFGIRTCVLVKTSFKAPSSLNRFYAYGSFKKGSYGQRAFNGFLYYIHMPNFGLKFCPRRWAPSGNIGVA